MGNNSKTLVLGKDESGAQDQANNRHNSVRPNWSTRHHVSLSFAVDLYFAFPLCLDCIPVR